ncbi:hypothetical protein [Microbacterium tumbae]
MTTRQLRLLRAAAASSSATILAAVSHTVGGGMPPHPLLVVAVSVLLVPLAAALIGRRPSPARTAVTVVLAQLVFHVLFHVLGATMTTTAAPPHSHELVLGPVVATALPDAPMLLSHLCAAALTAVLLWHGERMLRGVGAWVQARLLRLLPAVPARHDVPGIPASPVLTVTLAPLGPAVSRRGPPSV